MDYGTAVRYSSRRRPGGVGRFLSLTGIVLIGALATACDEDPTPPVEGVRQRYGDARGRGARRCHRGSVGQRPEPDRDDGRRRLLQLQQRDRGIVDGHDQRLPFGHRVRDNRVGHDQPVLAQPHGGLRRNLHPDGERRGNGDRRGHGARRNHGGADRHGIPDRDDRRRRQLLVRQHAEGRIHGGDVGMGSDPLRSSRTPRNRSPSASASSRWSTSRGLGGSTASRSRSRTCRCPIPTPPAGTSRFRSARKRPGPSCRGTVTPSSSRPDRGTACPSPP